MGQPEFLPSTNVLPFPRVRAERKEPGSDLKQGGGSCYSANADLSLGAAPQPGRPTTGLAIAAVYAAVRRRAKLVEPTLPLRISSVGVRAVAAGLILICLLSTLAFGARSWLGERDHSLRSMAVSHGDSTERAVVITLPVISTPAVVKAVGGKQVAFPIAIKGAGPSSGGVMIAVSRLPSGGRLSAGVPQSETKWKLERGEIENLSLMIPKTARGDATLLVQLLTPDGHVISDSATIVEVAPGSGAEIPVHRVKTQIIHGQIWDLREKADERTAEDKRTIPASAAYISDPVPLPDRRPSPLTASTGSD